MQKRPAFRLGPAFLAVVLFVVAAIAVDIIYLIFLPAPLPDNHLTSREQPSIPSASDIPSDALNISTDIDALVKHLQLPVVPQAVWWFERKLGNSSSRVPGPTDFELIACLQLTPTEIGLLLADAGENQGKKRIVDIQDWMPAIVVKQEKKLRVKVYDAAHLVTAPYSVGKIEQVVDQPFVFLKLYTN